MSWTVQKKNFDPPHPGGWGGGGGLGVNISKVREISWTAEKIDKYFFDSGHLHNFTIYITWLKNYAHYVYNDHFS